MYDDIDIFLLIFSQEEKVLPRIAQEISGNPTLTTIIYDGIYLQLNPRIEDVVDILSKVSVGRAKKLLLVLIPSFAESPENIFNWVSKLLSNFIVKTQVIPPVILLSPRSIVKILRNRINDYYRSRGVCKFVFFKKVSGVDDIIKLIVVDMLVYKKVSHYAAFILRSAKHRGRFIDAETFSKKLHDYLSELFTNYRIHELLRRKYHPRNLIKLLMFYFYDNSRLLETYDVKRWFICRILPPIVAAILVFIPPLNMLIASWAQVSPYGQLFSRLFSYLLSLVLLLLVIIISELISRYQRCKALKPLR